MKKTLLLLLFMLSLGAVSIFAQPAGWGHSQVISVTENSGATFGGYQLKLTLDTQTPIGLGQMQANGEDIRFGSLCNVADLNYWIESGINTVNTIVWVQLDTLHANETKDIMMFYGNPSAPAASSVSAVFYAPSSGPNSATDSVTGLGAGGVGNSQRGFRFSPNEDILVTAFGKDEPNGTTRYVTLFNFATQAVIAQQQVSGPAGQYSYTDLTSPVWLTAGTQYLLEIYQNSSDGYYFGNSSQIGQNLTYYDMRYCNSCTQNTFPTNTLSNYHYGVPDLWYCIKMNITPAPTYSTSAPYSLNLGADGDSCDIAHLYAGFPGGTYLWSTGDTTQTLTVSTTAAYSVIVTTPNTQCLVYDTISLVINPSPTINLGTDTTYCDSGTLTAAGNGNTFMWNTTETTQSIIVNTTGTYTATAYSVAMCNTTDTIQVVVNPNPVLSYALSTDSICQNASAVNIDEATPAGGSYSGSGISGTSFDPSSVGIGNQVITYMYTDGTTGCSSSIQDSIKVLAPPVVSFTLLPNAYCIDHTSVTLAGGTPAGGTYSGVGISGTDNFDPSTAGAGTHSIIYTYTDPSTGCSSVAGDAVTIFNLPAVSFNYTTSTACINYSPMPLSGGSPAGGVYSGTGVSGSNFDPSSGVGNHVLTYTYTDVHGCSNFNTDSVMVLACTGIEENGSNRISIYPNPNNGGFYIGYESTGDAIVVNVYNVLGQQIYSDKLVSNPQMMNLDVKPGTYMVEVIQGTQVSKKKVIIQ